MRLSICYCLLDDSQFIEYLTIVKIIRIITDNIPRQYILFYVYYNIFTFILLFIVTFTIIGIFLQVPFSTLSTIENIASDSTSHNCL